MKSLPVIISILIIFFIIGSGCITVNVPESSPISFPVQGTSQNTIPTTEVPTQPPTSSYEETVSPSPTITDTQAGASNSSPSTAVLEETPNDASSGGIVPTETVAVQDTEISSDSQSPSTDVGMDTANQPSSNSNSLQNTEENNPPEMVIVEISSDEINRHFMNIVFGTKRSTVDKWAFDVPLQTSVDNLYLPDDIVTLQTFAKEFNKLSDSTKLSENVKEQSKGRLNFKFISEDGLKLIDMDDIQEVCLDLEDDSIIYLVSYRNDKNEIFTYFNKDLTGYKRSHYLIRALLYMLGFAGYTVDYPDSIFYVYSDTNTKLSIFDKEAIKLLYGNSIKPGMTEDQVRRVLMMK
jgi:hypothetical protein